MFFRRKEKVDRDLLELKKTITKLQKQGEFDKESALRLLEVSDTGAAIQYFPAEFQDDRDIVEAAINCSWDSFQFASEDLRCDEEIILSAIQMAQTADDYESPDSETSDSLRFHADVHREIISHIPDRFFENKADFYRCLQNFLNIELDGLGSLIGGIFVDKILQLFSDREWLIRGLKETEWARWHIPLRFRYDGEVIEITNSGRTAIDEFAEQIGPHFHEENIESQYITGDLYLNSNGLIATDADLVNLLHALKLVYENSSQFDKQQLKQIEDNPQFLNNILDHYETTSSGSTVDDVRNDIESGLFLDIADVFMDQDLIENVIRLMLDLEMISEAKNYKP